MEWYIMDLIKKIAELEIENKMLKEKIKEKEQEVFELTTPEHMTPAENRAYWGIYG